MLHYEQQADEAQPPLGPLAVDVSALFAPTAYRVGAIDPRRLSFARPYGDARQNWMVARDGAYGGQNWTGASRRDAGEEAGQSSPNPNSILYPAAQAFAFEPMESRAFYLRVTKA